MKMIYYFAYSFDTQIITYKSQEEEWVALIIDFKGFPRATDQGLSPDTPRWCLVIYTSGLQDMTFIVSAHSN